MQDQSASSKPLTFADKMKLMAKSENKIDQEDFVDLKEAVKIDDKQVKKET